MTGAWVLEAACAGTPLELWFGPDTDDKALAQSPTRKGFAAEAIALCATCPVKAACLQHALEAPERTGIWGGTTPSMRGWRHGYATVALPRKAIVKRTDGRIKPLRHGTWAGYKQHRKYGSAPCKKCLEAARIRSRESKAAKKPQNGTQGSPAPTPEPLTPSAVISSP